MDMKIRSTKPFALTLALVGLCFASRGFAEPPAPASSDAKTKASTPAADAEAMAKMEDLAKPGTNHQLLADLVGTWDYKVTMWMAPGAPPIEATGKAVRKPALDGHYFVMESSSKMQYPGPDGKMTTMDFKGMSVEGYDNVKQKFVASWTDNMGTGIYPFEGTYDPATKAFTYLGEMEPLPGMKMKVREVLSITDKNHQTLEWYEVRKSGEVKTMEIVYTREK